MSEQKHVLASDGGYVNEIYVETTCHASFQNQENSVGKFTQHMPDPDDYVRVSCHFYFVVFLFS